MVHTQRIMLSLLIAHTIATTDLMAESNLHTKDTKIVSHQAENSESVSSEKVDKSSEKNIPEKSVSSIFSEKEIAEMEFVFENSPKEAQHIVNHLQDPTYFPMSENYRSVIFVGEPETDTTIMANAIAYKMSQSGWKYQFLSHQTLQSNPTFSRRDEDETISNLQRKLERSVASGKPTIVVIDGLHNLLENREVRRHGIDEKNILWTFLDAQKNNDKFFLIVTMHNTDKLPKLYKEKILFDCIHFEALKDPNIQNQVFRNILKNNNIKVDGEVSDNFLIEQFQKAGFCRQDLHKLAMKVCRITKMNNPEISNDMVIKKASISQAVNELIHLKKVMNYESKDETYEKQQERHHQERMSLQKKFHDEQKLLYKEAQKQKKNQFEEALITIASLRR